MFDEVRIDGGQNYDPTTGIYTVPINGFYEFNVQIYVHSDAAISWAFYFAVDGKRVTDSAHAYNGATYDNISSTATVMY